MRPQYINISMKQLDILTLCCLNILHYSIVFLVSQNHTLDVWFVHSLSLVIYSGQPIRATSMYQQCKVATINIAEPKGITSNKNVHWNSNKADPVYHNGNYIVACQRQFGGPTSTLFGKYINKNLQSSAMGRTVVTNMRTCSCGQHCMVQPSPSPPAPEC